MNILLTCTGRRHYLAKFFHQAVAGDGKIVGTDVSLTAPALAACDVAKQVPAVSAENYLDLLLETMKEHQINMLFSLNDLELELLVKNRDLIEHKTGATVYVPSPEALAICADKWETFKFAKNIGVPVPETWLTVDSALKALDSSQVSFPLIVKPRWGSASIGLFVVHDKETLNEAFEACERAVAGSLLASFGSTDAVIIQEMLEGTEYGVDLLFGKQENLIGFAAKKKLAMRAGETDKAVSVEAAPFKQSVEALAANLAHRGNMDCDFIERNGIYYLLEINPRFGGGYPFTHLAGANHVQMLLDDYADKPLQPYSYEIGKGFAKYDDLVAVPNE